jgi:hypothetical protein
MRIILLLDEGISYREITEQLGAFPSTISRWKQRFEKDGLLGLATIHPGQPPQKLTPLLRAKVLDKTQQMPPDDSTHWSLGDGGSHEGQQNLIARIWKEADLKPHRLELYMTSNDLKFEEKAAEIIGLYRILRKTPRVLCRWEERRVQFNWTGRTGTYPYRQDGLRTWIGVSPSRHVMTVCRAQSAN